MAMYDEKTGYTFDSNGNATYVGDLLKRKPLSRMTTGEIVDYFASIKTEAPLEDSAPENNPMYQVGWLRAEVSRLRAALRHRSYDVHVLETDLAELIKAYNKVFQRWGHEDAIKLSDFMQKFLPR